MSDGWQLAIESTAPEASVALGGGGREGWERRVAAGSRPSEVLMTPLQEALERIPEGERLGVVVVGSGPGSYNGARVAIAAAQGIGLVRGCGTVGISSLEALETVRRGGPCLAVGDARRGTFFAVALAKGMVAGPIELLDREALVARVEDAAAGGCALVTLEGVERLGLSAELAGQVRQEVPRAGLLLEAWQARSAEEQKALREIAPEPFYLREAYITTPRRREEW